ncbi:MAG: TIGR00725 family protein [Myxococcales bacterium]|nr:TIGR00725 family protein [Myxococcales bacterium]
MRRKVVAVVGNSAATEEACGLARELGRALVDQGYRVVTGGMTGVMEAASLGAHDSELYTEGSVLGIIPSGEASRANAYVDIVIPSGLGYARNTLVVNTADAVVAVAGGAGTLNEVAMAWQLGKPIIALEIAGWSQRLAGTRIDERQREEILAAGDVEAVMRHLARVLG